MHETWIAVHREAGIEFAASTLHPGAYPGHLHTTAEFLLQLHGPGFASVRGCTLLLRPGDLLAILPNELHARMPSPLIQFAALEIDPAELRHRAGAELPATLEPLDPIRLWRAALSPEEVRGLEGAMLEDLVAAVARMRRLVLERALDHPVLRRGLGARCRTGLPTQVLQEARGALDCEADLERLRRISGFSWNYFITACRQSFGLPPHQLLLGRRLDRARAAVIATGDRLVDIAAEHGFYDQSHLCRLFKRAYAVSPAAYRQSVRLQAPAG